MVFKVFHFELNHRTEAFKMPDLSLYNRAFLVGPKHPGQD